MAKDKILQNSLNKKSSIFSLYLSLFFKSLPSLQNLKQNLCVYLEVSYLEDFGGKGFGDLHLYLETYLIYIYFKFKKQYDFI